MRVVEAAAKLFRQYGFDGVGIDAVMAEAGLTHGGFYKSFASKDELIAEACRHVTEQRDKSAAAEEAKAVEPFAALVGQYLSKEHCRESASACLFATLAGDAARRDTSIRSAFGDGLQAFVDHIVTLLPEGEDDRRREVALAAAATMIGAVTMARATDDAAFAQDILEAARAALLSPAADSTL